MKQLKTFLIAAMAAVGLAAQADQPIVWTCYVTNASIPLNPAVNVGTTGTNMPLSGLIFTNETGTASQSGYLDCLLQSQVSIAVAMNQTCVAAGAVNSTNVLQTLVSQDGSAGSWGFGPQYTLVNTLTNTTYLFVTNQNMASWRYLTFTNLVQFATNCWTTNAWQGGRIAPTNSTGNFKIMVMFKGS